MAFGGLDHNLLASVGTRYLKLWDIDGYQLWSYDLSNLCVALLFSQDNQKLIVAMRPHLGVQLSVEDGSELQRHQFIGGSVILSITRRKTTLTISISNNGFLLAVVDRGRSVRLWSLHEELKWIGFCGRNPSSPNPGVPPLAALFNPSPSENLLVVAYHHGEMALYDSMTQKELTTVDCYAFAIASIPDGTTLSDL